MNFPLYIAKKIYNDQGDKRKVSRPAIRIATIGVAIGLAVMIVTVSVVLGFKHTIRDKVVGFGSHIQVHNIMNYSGGDPHPICANDSLMNAISKLDGVAHAERFSMTQGILKTDEDFLGVAFKGIAAEYDTTFLSKHLTEGSIPEFSDSASHYKLLISKMIADKMRLKAGDKVYGYFIDNEDVRTRRFTIAGIYQTNMTRFDETLCFTDLYTANKLNGWTENQATGIEVLVKDFERLDLTANAFIDNVNRSSDEQGNSLTSETIYELYPQVFSWLELLDINVWIILALMVMILIGQVKMNKKQIESFTNQLHEIRTENQNTLISVDSFSREYVELSKELQQYVDDEKRLIEKAEEDRQSVSMMVAGISHDFRTPLTAATGYLQMAQQSGKLPKEEAEYVDTALRKMKYLRELSDEFFTLSLIDKPEEDEESTVSLKRILEDVTLGQYEWIEKRGLEFSSGISEDPCEICASEVDIIRLLENIYSNARKYAKSYLHVELTKPEVGKMVLSVSNDTDIIKSEDVDSVFKPFHRAASGEAEGSGLGLYIAKKITEKYGGEITAELDENIFSIYIFL